MKHVKPWMVVLALAIVGAAGATSVFYLADAQHDRDRRDISAWLRIKLPAAQDAQRRNDVVASLDRQPIPEIGRTATMETAAVLEDERKLLAPPVPEILRPVTAAYVAAMKATIAALMDLQIAIEDAVLSPTESQRFAMSWARARDRFKAGTTARDELICRARLPSCMT